jgi:hypothetical protein
MVKKTYRIWMVIEECTIDDDGNETYEDFDEYTVSAGKYSSLEEAQTAMERFHNETK